MKVFDLDVYTRAGGVVGLYVHHYRPLGIGKQLFRVYLTAHNGTRIKPELNFALNGGPGVFVSLPYVPFNYAVGPVGRAAYRASEKFWHAVHRFTRR